jgi:glycerophosphoryl diester phosphodiesterase
MADSTRALVSLAHPIAIAHRGGAKLRPENSPAAFDHAVSLGVTACECDVHLSSDGEVVVIHDATLDRTTNATGPVSARTARELADLGVPRLAELLDRHRGVEWIVEIKGARPDLAERTVGVLRDLDAIDRVIVGSFSQRSLDAVRQIAPKVATGASSREAHAAARRALFRLPWGRRPFQALQVPFRVRGREVFGESFVRQARRASVPLHVWVVDEPSDMRRLLSWGVTGLISDRPDIALREISARGAPESRPR